MSRGDCHVLGHRKPCKSATCEQIEHEHEAVRTEHRDHIVAYIKSREAHYRARETDAIAKHVASRDDLDIEAAVFAARVANILGCVADDIDGGEPFGSTPAPSATPTKETP